jgi:hypothetical protein
MEKSKLMGCNPVRKIGNYGIENHETRPVEMSRRFSCTEGPKDRFHEALQFAVEGAHPAILVSGINRPLACPASHIVEANSQGEQ